MAERGRPTKYTDELAVAICEAIASGVPEVIAAQAAGIHRSTLHEWKKCTPSFSDAIKRARAKAIVERIETVRKAAKGGDEIEVIEKTIKHKDGKLERVVTRKKTPPLWTAAAWYLERQVCEEFGQNRIELKELLNLLKSARKVK